MKKAILCLLLVTVSAHATPVPKPKVIPITAPPVYAKGKTTTQPPADCVENEIQEGTCEWIPAELTVADPKYSCDKNVVSCAATVSYSLVSGVQGQNNSELKAVLCPSGIMAGYKCAVAPTGTFRSNLKVSTEMKCGKGDEGTIVYTANSEVGLPDVETPIADYCRVSLYSNLTDTINPKTEKPNEGKLYCCPAPAKADVFKDAIRIE